MRFFAVSLLGLSALGLGISCMERSVGLKSASPSETRQVVAPAPGTYNAHADSVGEVSGNAVIQPALDGRALILALTPLNDSRVERIFVLQSEIALGIPAQSFEAARIRYNPKSVIVLAPRDRKAVILHINGASFDVPPTAAATATVVGGFGLSRRGGWFALVNGSIPTPAVERIVSLSCNTEQTGTFGPLVIYPGCNAGGPGSSNCSITCSPHPGQEEPWSYACSTTCGSGYYSCCTCSAISGAGCTCYRNPRASTAPATPQVLASASPVPPWYKYGTIPLTKS